MKKLYQLSILVIIFLIFNGCKKDNSQSFGVPKGIIINASDTVIVNKTDRILPNNANCKVLEPILFDTAIIQRRIIITVPTEVYVTIVSTQCSYTNSLGFYTYNINEIPSTANKQILFCSSSPKRVMTLL